jgi:hypothetical protein
MIDVAQRNKVYPPLANLLHHPAEILDETGPSTPALPVNPASLKKKLVATAPDGIT